MAGFVSRFTNRIDRKGRISVPASFRQVLAADGHDGLHCYLSLDMQTLDAGGNELLAEIGRKLARFETFTEEHEYMLTAFYGSADRLTFDTEGRIGLPDGLRAAAGIDDTVVFVGHGYKFQMWEPGRYAEHEAEARRRALTLRRPAGAPA